MSHKYANKSQNKYRSGGAAFDDLVSKAFGDDFFFDSGFGSFGGFGNGRGMLGRGFDDEDFGFGPSIFSDFVSMQSGSGPKNGTVISKSYVSTVKYGEDGKPKKQEYSSQSIDQYTKDGRISEKRNSYQDYERGIKKAAHQRMINDQGHKIVKTKDYYKNEDFEDHYYNGLNEGKFSIK